jgi:predicted 2-oxoglutarate/Fe(II)-dependent dioxygenase YbiX
MSNITDDLASLLAEARRPGDFHVSGVVETYPPGLSVVGVGEIALPLLPFQARQLVASASAAPFGRGAETVYDPNVRRTWQIGPGQVKIASRHWAQTLQTVLTRVGEGLGVEDPIEAELYKLLVYDEGSFFVSHRDTEKSPGMFATLVIVLPSVCSGGELIVRHGGREAKLDMHGADAAEIAFAAFYADCVHEVLPVTSGCRLALVYNLVRRGKRGTLAPPNHEREQAAAAALLGEWAGRGDTPTKIVYLLEHAYTQAELGFPTLKGADSAAAAILVEAAGRAGCDLHLALLTIEENGAAEYADTPRSRRDRWSEPELEAGEVFDSSRTLSQWRRPDGAPSPLDELPFEDDEISPSKALEEMDPDEEHFQEHAGNEGATFERSYSRAALVLWPSGRIFAVINQAGLDATLPFLADMAKRWTASGKDRRSQLWRDARALSEEMLRTWPPAGPHYRADGVAGAVAGFLGTLTELGDEPRIEEFLTRVVVAGAFTIGDNPSVVAALRVLPPEQGGDLLLRIVAGTAAAAFERSADLLARAAATAGLGGSAQRLATAKALVAAMPAKAQEPTPANNWRRDFRVTSRAFVDLVRGVAAIDAEVADRAVAFALARPQIYEMDGALVPATSELTSSGETKDASAVKSLRAACLAHLCTRIAETLEPPADWRRASAVGCKCENCAELSAFLADPARGVWRFRAVESVRSHVEETIKSSRVDISTKTEMQGCPYTLVSTKNQASYDRAVKQRAADIANVEALAGFPVDAN